MFPIVIDSEIVVGYCNRRTNAAYESTARRPAETFSGYRAPWGQINFSVLLLTLHE